MSSIERAARLLMAEHLLEDPGLQAIYWSPCDQEVRLIEITGSAPERQAIQTQACAPDPPFTDCPAQLIVLHPGDWARVLAGTLSLPDGFTDPVRLH